MSEEGIADRIRARAAETGADIVLLPAYVDEQTGKGVYAEDALFLVKRLKNEGIHAEYLDASADRYFVTQKSALLVLASTIGIGIATNAAWDGIKKIISLARGKGKGNITINLTNASGTEPARVSLTGSPAQVIDALERLKARGHLSAETAAPILAASSAPDDDDGDAEITDGPGPPTNHCLKQIEAALDAGNNLLDRSRKIFISSPAERAEAERLAREALSHFRSALNWAEDTGREEEAHEVMDAAGRWTRETFGCVLEYADGTYYQTCPVDLGHNRVGFSIGGVATRVCSLCDLDISECEHDPSQEYLTPGGTSPLGYCRICMEQICAEHKPGLMYPARPGAIVTEIQLDEISIVARPAHPDARIHRQDVPLDYLKAVLGEAFAPGMTVTCDRCLGDCGGLIQMKGFEDTR